MSGNDINGGDILRLGLVGCGYHSLHCIVDCFKGLPARFVAACDTDAARLGALASFYGIDGRYEDYNQMLDRERLDAVICVVGPQVHYEVAKACFARRIPIFVEKTPCMSSAQATELAELARTNGVFGMAGFNRRFMPGYIMAREIASRPEFGKPTMFFTRFNASAYSSEPQYLIQHLVHSIDFTRFMLGEYKITHVDRVFIDDRRVGYHIGLVSDGGVIGIIQSGSLQNLQYPVERMELTGVGRMVCVDNARHLTYNRSPINKSGLGRAALSDENDTLLWNPNHANLVQHDYNGFAEELEYFVKCVRENTPPQPDFADAARTMALLEDVRARLGVAPAMP